MVAPRIAVCAVAANCDDLRAKVTAAKRERNEAMKANALATDAGAELPHIAADIDVMRLAVDVATLDARNAGCDVDDLVGPNVGQL